MKRIAMALVPVVMLALPAFGGIAMTGKEKMVRDADLIAIVDIQELASTDKSRIYVDLLANGTVAHVLKGEARGAITFRIPRFFPCAAFDVSIGRHLVFLKKDEAGNYAGVNWYMSYVLLTVPKAKWYDKDGAVTAEVPPEEIRKDVQELIRATGEKADSAPVPAGAGAPAAREGKPASSPEPAELMAGGTATRFKGSRPYVVTGPEGLFYARSVPVDEAGRSTRGTTKIYRVRSGADELVDSYDWYAPRQFKTGMILGWSPIAGKIAVMRIHDEPEPLTDERVELSFYIGGRFLKSYTVKDLAAGGCPPRARGKHPDEPRQALEYKIAGWELGPTPNEYRWSVMVTDDRKVLFDPLTGEVVADPRGM